MVFGVVIITPLLPIIGSKFSNVQEQAKLEKTLASEEQTSDDDLSESSDKSSEDVNKTVTFAEHQETFEIPEYSDPHVFEVLEYSGRPRSITVV